MTRPRLVLDASTAWLLARVDILRSVTQAAETYMALSAFQALGQDVTTETAQIRNLEREGVLFLGSPKKESKGLAGTVGLDAVEADTLALAWERKAGCASDDASTLLAARVIGVPFTSAVGLLVAMTEQGALDSEVALNCLEWLDPLGRYEVRILEDAARRIQESKRKGRGGTS